MKTPLKEWVAVYVVQNTLGIQEMKKRK